jgi:hypothetical protein
MPTPTITCHLAALGWYLKNKSCFNKEKFRRTARYVSQRETKKLTGWETQPAQEGGENNNFIGIRHGDIFIPSRPPLRDVAIREKVVVDESKKLTLIDGQRLKHFWMRGGHGSGARVWA